MPVFESATDDCDYDQTVGKTTAKKARWKTSEETVTLWCGDCEKYHGFEERDR